MTYYEPKSQTSPKSIISSVANKQIVDPLTTISPRVYKDSSLLGTFPSIPPPISDLNSLNFCMMQSSQAALKRPASASQQPPRPSQPTPSPSIQPSGPPPPGPSPTAGIHELLYPPGMVPPGLNHIGAVSPSHYPFGQISLLAPPPGVNTILVMATLSLPNLTLGIPV